MPILRLVAEGVGPFEKLDLDLSDGKGNPHLGPHILAGVNGAGKSTVLKTIAWVLDEAQKGFDLQDWSHSLAGHERSHAALVLGNVHAQTSAQAVTSIKTRAGMKDLVAWTESHGLGHVARFGVETLSGVRFPVDPAPVGHHISSGASSVPTGWLRQTEQESSPLGVQPALGSLAAYAPSRNLRYLPAPDLRAALGDPFHNCLAFGETIRNDMVQSWLVGLHSKHAIARQTRQPAEEYAQALERFESALRLIYGDRLRLVPELKPGLHPRIQAGNQSLNFSQLPDGVRTTIGWLSDFMMRQDLMKWDPRLNGKRPGLLLLDEVETHLHPQWQRTLLPAMREALPDVQIIVTSHSPFVISSCPGSRVHVLEVDQNGRASLKLPSNAPVGHSVMAILKDIFGVESRFDVRTEKELDEWYRLSRREAVGPLPASDRRRMEELTRVLSDRSESLKGIVFKPSGLSGSIESVLRAVGGSAGPPSRSKAKPRQKKAS